MAAPISRLPIEILSLIFVSIAQSSQYAASIRDKSYGKINYLLQLSSVCVRWRQVATSTPRLWSFLDFSSSRHTPKYLQYMKLCYERSGNTPLSVRIRKHERQCDLETVDGHLATILISCAARLESLSITHYHFLGFPKEVLSLLLDQGAAGRIRKLALNTSWEDDVIRADSSLSQDTLNQLLEPLHSLVLEYVAFDWNTIPCRNLVELQLDRPYNNMRPSSSQLVSFLNMNPAIRVLKIWDSAFFTHESGLPPIKPPELQNLDLIINPEFAGWFFTLLTPGTRGITLRIDSRELEPYPFRLVDTFRQFFQRSRVVSLQIWSGRWIPFSSVAAYLPYLETLRVDLP